MKATSKPQVGGTMEDHYFEARMTGPDGAEITTPRQRTPQGAWADVLDLPQGSYGSIWYHGEPGDAPVEYVRFCEDGTAIDAFHDDGSNYPLGGVTEYIEPGAMMFSLWFRSADGDAVPYDFGFDWDGAHSADFQCVRGDDKLPGSPVCVGAITWSNRHDFYNDVDEDEYDDLGDDLHVIYTSTSSAGAISGQAVIPCAAVVDSINRDGWVEAARDLFAFLSERGLV
jgi:hypothetical protein